jgi:hypothetical protein
MVILGNCNERKYQIKNTNISEDIIQRSEGKNKWENLYLGVRYIRVELPMRVANKSNNTILSKKSACSPFPIAPKF